MPGARPTSGNALRRENEVPQAATNVERQVAPNLGSYSVPAKIGEGGMGQVWQATDTQLHRQVALKVLPEAFTSEPDSPTAEDCP